MNKSVFFSIRVILHGHWRLTGQEGKGGDQLFIPLYHYHPLTNIQTFILQLCTWDDFRIFLIAPLVFTRLLLDEIYHLIELPFDWLIWCWFLFVYLLIWFKAFVTAIWLWKPVDLNSRYCRNSLHCLLFSTTKNKDLKRISKSATNVV